MPSATLTSKGQITIPVKVRAALGLAPGDRVAFTETATGSFAISAATQPVSALRGLVKKPAGAVSVEDMNRIIAKRGAASA